MSAICFIEDYNQYETQVKKLGLTKKLFLFGAGSVGTHIGQYLDKKGIPWCGYVDSDPQKAGKTLNKKKIYHISQLEEADIIIEPTVGEGKMPDIEAMLDNMGFDYISVRYNGFFPRIISETREEPFGNLKRLKDIHRNERCFIVGNGPSLKSKDLEKIKNEKSFGVNLIYRYYPYTAWRPTYFVSYDLTTEKTILEDGQLEMVVSGSQYIFASVLSQFYNTELDKMQYPNMLLLPGMEGYDDGFPLFSSDVSEAIYLCGTSIYLVYQIAAYMGFEKVYLIGMDFSFARTHGLNGEIIVNEGVKDHSEIIGSNHTNVYHANEILRGHQAAKKYADEQGMEIYNATRGGMLEVFPRVDFDSLF